MRTLNPSLALASLVGFLTAASCTLITDVDRTKIPTDAGAEAGSPSTGGTGETSGTGGTAENGGTQNGGTGGSNAGEGGENQTGGSSGTGGTSGTGGASGSSGTSTGATGGSAGAAPVTPVCSAATGTITLAPQTFLSDKDTFTLGDGVNAKVVFEFDLNSDGVTTGHVAIPFNGTEDQFGLAELVKNAINALGDDTLRVTATLDQPSGSGNGEAGAGGEAGGTAAAGAGGQNNANPPNPATDTAQIDLKNDLAGARGNVKITKTVGNPNFKVSGMSGGDAVECASAASCSGADECSGTCGADNVCEN